AEVTKQTTIQAAEHAKQKSHQIMENIVKPANNLVATVRSTSRVAKWSIILISSGIFLFGLSKAVMSVNESYDKYSKKID
ncbi:MAG: hypothetical protein MUO21_12160, partial [Nitrososphaeraceae archaeon]|nr:hypothetical protein [Nitrososphaeraceae archaeon]